MHIKNYSSNAQIKSPSKNVCLSAKYFNGKTEFQL